MTTSAHDDAPSGIPAGMIEFHAGPPGGDSTRHLCAAANLDHDFRDRVIEELVENRHRVAAPTPGADAGRVLAECLWARREAFAAGAAVLAVLLIGLVLDPVAALAAVGIVLSVRIAGAFSAMATGLWAAWYRMDRNGPVLVRVRRALTLLLSLLSLVPLLLFVVADAVSGIDGGGDEYSYDQSSSNGGISAWAILLVLVCWVAIGAVRRYRLHARLAQLGTPGNTRPAMPTPPALAPVFQRLHIRQSDVETVYGDFSPFVGSGEVFDHWSYHSDLRPAPELRDSGRRPEPLSVPRLHARVAQAIDGLGFGTDYPGDLMHRVTVQNRLFRSGLRSDRPELWYGGLSAVDPATGRMTLRTDLAEALDQVSHERIRHYLEARVELWQGQVVASVFLRVHLQGRMLRIEGVPCVLPPVAEQYRVVDEVLPPNSAKDTLGAVAGAVTHLGRDLLSAFTETWGMIRSGFRVQSRQQWYDRMLRLGRAVDHAPRVSLRELGAERHYQQLFQALDVERFFTAVQERALSAVLDELRQAGYDTSALEQVVQNVTINNGIQNVNSTVHGPQAAGPGATARSGGSGGGLATPGARLGSGG